MIAWMTYSIVVGALVAIAGLAGEQIARIVRLPVRWGWAGALIVTLALSVWAPYRDFNSSNAAATSVSAAASPVAATSLNVSLGSVTRWVPSTLSPVVIGAWVAASAVMLVLMLSVYARLRRTSRTWPLTDVHGARVRVSPRTGPVVIGLARPEIVVPQWLLVRDERDQRLVIVHEAEHVAAWDNVLLTSACVLCALMPWNPAAWFMLSRLRLAVEVDCDARVLRRGVELQSYGTLLIDVAAHGSPLRFGFAALANSRSHLHQRILAMKSRVPKFARVRAGFAGVVAAGTLLAACEAKMPTAAEVDQMDVASAESRARASGLIRSDSVVYIVDGMRVAKGEAHKLTASKVATVDVAGAVKGQPAFIEVHTVDGAKRKMSPGGEGVLIPTRVSGNAAQPIVYVDGVRGAMEDFRKLDPKDIASVEVIKGASAVAEYGADATNGVISVKTKKTASPE